MTVPPGADAAESRRLLVRELAAGSESLVTRLVARARAEIPAYSGVEAADIQPTTVAMLDRLLSALSEQRPPTGGELAAYREYGGLRAEQGISIVEVLQAWRLAVRMLLEDMATISVRDGVPDRVQLDLTNEFLDTVDHAILELTGGHREVEIAFARRDQQRRADFTRGLLLGLLGPSETGAEASRYGLDAEREWIAFRARPSPGTPAEELDRLVGATGATLTTTIDGDLAGVVGSAADADPRVVVGYGRPARLDDLSASFATASRVLTTAVAFGLTGAHDLSGLGLLPAVHADAELGDELVRRYLAPIGPGSEMIIDTVRCCLAERLRVDAVAEQLFVHPNTVRYRIARFEQLTGADLRQPQDAFEVWWALQRATLIRRSTTTPG